MPISILELASNFNLKIAQSVKWGKAIHEKSLGIYIVSANKNVDIQAEDNSPISFNNSQLKLWMQNAPEITLYGDNPSIDDLKKHLAGFWLPDETITYIGKAEKQSLQTRVSQYYRHKVGKRSPHKGGYWLKLLSDLNNYYIHILPTKNSHEIEEQMLQYFIENVSDKAKMKLIDKELCLPFANLQLRSGVRKKHGLNNHCQ